MNRFLNNVEDPGFIVPSRRDMLILDPGTRISRALQLAENSETLEFLQLSEKKHLEHEAADAAVVAAASDLAEHRAIDTTELNAGGKVQHAATLRELQTNQSNSLLQQRHVDASQESMFALLMVPCSTITSEDMQNATNKKNIRVMYRLLTKHAMLPAKHLATYDGLLGQLALTADTSPVHALHRFLMLVDVRSSIFTDAADVEISDTTRGRLFISMLEKSPTAVGPMIHDMSRMRALCSLPPLTDLTDTEVAQLLHDNLLLSPPPLHQPQKAPNPKEPLVE
jgi:hypothetical protein